MHTHFKMENFYKSGGGEILSNYLCLISEHEVGELIHQITYCYHNNYFNVKHITQSSSSFTLTIPREQRNFFVTR